MGKLLQKMIMKSKDYIKITISVVIGIIGVVIYMFMKKTYIEFELVGSAPVQERNFAPYAYCYITDKEHLDSYFYTMEKNFVDEYEFVKKVRLDIVHYNYIICAGAKIESIHYSLFDTFLNDPSPSYCKAWKLFGNTIFITYEGKKGYIFPLSYNDKGDGMVYIYKINKNTGLHKPSGL